MPSPLITNNEDGTININYLFSEGGILEANIISNDISQDGFPLKLNVDSKENELITVYGQGLSKGSRNQKLKFFVLTTGKTENINVEIKGPEGELEVEKEINGKKITFIYDPPSSGEYHINIKNKGKHVQGSPFLAKVSGDGRKRSVINLSSFSDYTLGGKDLQLINLSGKIKTPDGEIVPVMLKRMANKKLGISSFQPQRKGTYTVEVIQEGSDVMGIPFQIQVTDSEICSAYKVKVSGATSEAQTGKWNEMKLDLTEAGFGTLNISVEGSHSFDLESKTSGMGEGVRVMYRPHEPGIYVLNIKFGPDHITGSPFMLTVTGKPSGKKRKVESIQISSPPIPATGKNSSLHLKLPGVSPLDLNCCLVTPSIEIEDCEIKDYEDFLFEINFTPFEIGFNVICIKQKGIHIKGSPLEFSVGEKSVGGSERIFFFGQGSEWGVLGKKNYFNIYTHECGNGNLSVGIDGPSEAKIQLIDTKTGVITACYEVDKEGDYFLGVKFNGEDIRGTPLRVKVPALCKKINQISMHNLKDIYEPEKPVMFTVNNNQAEGEFDGYVISPNNSKLELIFQELDPEESSCRFFPRDPGVYWVYVTFNDNFIPGCPCPFLIGSDDSTNQDSALVKLTGDGLRKAKIRKAANFSIDTQNCGEGILTIKIEGNGKASITCKELDNGYDFQYIMEKAGKFLMFVNFGNHKVPGSPFKIEVEGPEDKMDEKKEVEISNFSVEIRDKNIKHAHFVGNASQITLSGNALTGKCICGRACNFSLDIKDAGHGLLTISIISPSGNPVKELSYKKNRKSSYNVTFTPEEKGDHQIFIQWGDRDVTGSPYNILVH